MGIYATQQSSISENNRARILQYLYRNGISSRAQIAKALDLTPAAITKITAKLLDCGIIEETGDMNGNGHRRSIGLDFDCSKYHVIGVKFARSLVQIGLFDLKGNQLSLKNMPEVHDETINQTIDAIHHEINALLDRDQATVAIGMAVPGPYLKQVGRTAVVSSMQGWRTVNLLDEFAHAFRVPTFIEQDARAGALAEYLFDPQVKSDNLAYYLLGEGVGLGVIDHGHIIDGFQGAATEIGHISIDVNGRPCDCGNVGCLERYCSTPAIHDLIIEDGELIDNAKELSHAESARHLFTLASQGDNKHALAMIRAIARYVGFGCVTIINAFNPHHIILGDIVAEAGRPLLDEVRRVVHQRAIPELADVTKITLSNLSTNAAICGAAATAITQFINHPSSFFDFD